MKPHEAARLIGISVNTVRAWTMNEYRAFFSPSAQGGDGRNRELTDTDLRILLYINKIKHDGLQGDEVIAALKQVQQQGFDTLPMPVQTEVIAPTQMIPMRAADEAVIAERRIIAMLETQVQEYKERAERSEADREEYMRKWIAAETELKLWREGWRPPLKPTE